MSFSFCLCSQRADVEVILPPLVPVLQCAHKWYGSSNSVLCERGLYFPRSKCHYQAIRIWSLLKNTSRSWYVFRPRPALINQPALSPFAVSAVNNTPVRITVVTVRMNEIVREQVYNYSSVMQRNTRKRPLFQIDEPHRLSRTRTIG